MPTIFPILRFDDPDAGLAWLKDALGFEEHAVYRTEDGGIQHGEDDPSGPRADSAVAARASRAP
jgi:uncharacterized glyoxalase superfamily protein PhnB